MNHNNVIKKLDRAITSSVKNSVNGSKTFGILFSGGLDSSLIARICEEFGKSPALYSVGMEDSKDFEYIQRSKKFFDLKIKYREINSIDIIRYAKKVISVIEDCSPMSVGIGIPLYVACEMAVKDGSKVVLSGQGADELFGGYHRYLSIDTELLERELVRDLENLQNSGIKRDLAIAKANSLELGTPYLNEDVINVALSIDLGLKIKEGNRKYILRKIAERHDLPEFIINREKKAIQYSTGVDKALRKAAKRENKRVGDYLKDLLPVANQK